MFVKGEYPQNFTPYLDGYAIPNLVNDQVVNAMPSNLKYKLCVFDGDSICHGTSEGGACLGWAGRIANKYGVRAINRGFSGATITPNIGATSILTRFQGIIDHYSDADYYIFDGGTNDADRMFSTADTSIGTYTANDYDGPFDTTTFSGAFETLLKTAIETFPHGKVLYIVAI